MNWTKVLINLDNKLFIKHMTNFISNPNNLHIFFSYTEPETKIAYLISPYNFTQYSDDFLDKINNATLWMVKEELPK